MKVSDYDKYMVGLEQLAFGLESVPDFLIKLDNDMVSSQIFFVEFFFSFLNNFFSQYVRTIMVTKYHFQIVCGHAV